MIEQPLPDAINQALMHGDLSSLTPEQQLLLYQKTCASLGLNPLTYPLSYLELKGPGDKPRIVLYANKGCADQLRGIRGISTGAISREIEDGLCIVTSRSSDGSGRYVDDIGAVPIMKEDGEWQSTSSGKRYFKGNGRYLALQGEDRANAIKKAITQANRRSTLSFCGLGMLDESEIAGVADATAVESPITLPQQPALPSTSAIETLTTITPEDEKETTRPFIEYTPQRDASMGAQAPVRTNVSENESSAVAEKKPRRSREMSKATTENTDQSLASERKPIEKLSQNECVFRLQDELRRLRVTGQDPTTVQDRTDILTSVFGPEVDTVAKASNLGKSVLQKGLVKLADMTDVYHQQSTVESPVEKYMETVKSVDKAFEHGFPQEGTQAPPEEMIKTTVSPLTQWWKYTVNPGPNEAAEIPPENPKMKGMVVDPDAVRVLSIYAMMHDLSDLFMELTEGKPLEGDVPVLSLVSYKMIRQALLNAITREQRDASAQDEADAWADK